MRLTKKEFAKLKRSHAMRTAWKLVHAKKYTFPEAISHAWYITKRHFITRIWSGGNGNLYVKFPDETEKFRIITDA